jgi:Uma2 family endonuclease
MRRDSQRHYSVDDYFMVEEMSEVKHEYCNGEIFAMAGASLRHNEIAANLLAELRARLRETDCGVYGSDLRVQTPSGLYTYPDVSVICGKVQLVADRSDTATNPIIIVEVLSGATEEYDRGDKFELYKSMPSFRHYIVVSQTEILVDHFRRIGSDQWPCRSITDRKDAVEISEPQVSFSLDDIYRRVF